MAWTTGDLILDTLNAVEEYAEETEEKQNAVDLIEDLIRGLNTVKRNIVREMN